SAIKRVILIHDQAAVELAANRVGQVFMPGGFPQKQEADAAAAEFARNVREQRIGVGIVNVVRRAVGRQMHADSAGTPYARASIDNFHEKTCAVFDAATVAILPLVGAVLQKL